MARTNAAMIPIFSLIMAVTFGCKGDKADESKSQLPKNGSGSRKEEDSGTQNMVPHPEYRGRWDITETCTDNLAGSVTKCKNLTVYPVHLEFYDSGKHVKWVQKIKESTNPDSTTWDTYAIDADSKLKGDMGTYYHLVLKGDILHFCWSAECVRFKKVGDSNPKLDQNLDNLGTSLTVTKHGKIYGACMKAEESKASSQDTQCEERVFTTNERAEKDLALDTCKRKVSGACPNANKLFGCKTDVMGNVKITWHYKSQMGRTQEKKCPGIGSLMNATLLEP